MITKTDCLLNIIAQPIVDSNELFTGIDRGSVHDFFADCARGLAVSQHLLLQGDNRDVLPLIPDESVHLVITSPPYGPLVNYSGHLDGLEAAEVGSEGDIDKYLLAFEKILQELSRILTPDGSIVMVLGYLRPGGRGKSGPNGFDDPEAMGRRKGNPWSKQMRKKELLDLPAKIAALASLVGLKSRHKEIWHKPHCKPESVKDRSHQDYEVVLILEKGDSNRCDAKLLTAKGLPSKRAVFSLPPSHARYGHPAAFNPLLAERYIHAYTRPGDIVLDPFAGSGSVALSAMKLGRNSISIELYPQYLDTAFQRLNCFADEYKAKIVQPAAAALPFSEIDTAEFSSSPDFKVTSSDVHYMENYDTLTVIEPLAGKAAGKKAAIPLFPCHCLPAVMRDLFDDMVIQGAEQAIVGPSILAAWSAALGGRWQGLDSRNRTDQTNLQIVISATTGVGKKVSEVITGPHTFFEGVVERICKSRKQKEVPSLIFESITGASLMEELKHSLSGMFMFTSDAGGLALDLKRKVNGNGDDLLHILLKGGSGEFLREGRVGRGKKRLRALLSLLWLVQPEPIRDLLMNKMFISRGGAGRFLFLEIPKEYPQFEFERRGSSKPNPVCYEKWHALVGEAIRPRIRKSGKVIRHQWSEEAEQVFLDNHNQMVALLRGKWSNHELHFVRFQEHMKRICLCLWASEILSGKNSDTIDDAALAHQAAEIAWWFENRRYEYLFGIATDNLENLKLRVQDCLLKEPNQEKTFRNLETHNGISKEDCKRVHSDRREAGGRSTKARGRGKRGLH